MLHDAAQGIEAWRVDLLPLAAGNADHLHTYSLMDISLDPFPYAGEPLPPCLPRWGHTGFPPCPANVQVRCVALESCCMRAERR